MRRAILQTVVEQKIFLIRGQKVMLSTDLAELYGVSVKALVQSVKRNRKRFPPDFLYPLTLQEVRSLKSQIVTSSLYPLTLKEVRILKSQIVTSSWGGMRRSMPYAFTEQGVAMLSSVLRSARAIQVNIAIMRAFVKLREILSAHKELSHKLDELERKYEKHDGQIQSIFEAIRQLMTVPEKPKRRIGFLAEVDK